MSTSIFSQQALSLNKRKKGKDKRREKIKRNGRLLSLGPLFWLGLKLRDFCYDLLFSHIKPNDKGRRGDQQRHQRFTNILHH